MKFKEGDIVVAKESNHGPYSGTIKEGWIGRVLEVYDSLDIMTVVSTDLQEGPFMAYINNFSLHEPIFEISEEDSKEFLNLILET